MLDMNLLKTLAKVYGTPVYVYSEKTIVNKILQLSRVFSQHQYSLLYAMKANANPTLVKLIHANGFNIDACSTEEISLAIRCGVLPGNIYYNSDCLTPREIKFAVEQGVNITIGSLDAINFICENYSGIEISVRINTGIDSGHSDSVVTNGVMSKFGVLVSELDEIIKCCTDKSIKIVGLHSHTGSGDLSPDIYIENAIEVMKISARFNCLRYLNFGGGFGFDYKNSESYNISYVWDCLEQTRRELDINANIKFLLEPGRYIVADSAVLLSKVCSVKNYETRNYIGLDTGYNHFPRCFYYNAWHEIVNISTSEEETKLYDVTGYLCQSGDIFARERELPLTVTGDLLCIKDVGAYGFSMSSNFNLRTRPAEVMLTLDDNLSVIRRAETLDDILLTCHLD